MNEIQKADPRARRTALLLIGGVAVVAVVLMWLARSFMPEGAGGVATSLEEWMLSDPERVEDRRRLVAGLTGLAVVGPIMAPAVLVGIYFLRAGARIVRAERFPAPGTKVLRDTPVLRGKQARERGRIIQLLALLALAAAVGLLLIGWRLAAVMGSV